MAARRGTKLGGEEPDTRILATRYRRIDGPFSSKSGVGKAIMVSSAIFPVEHVAAMTYAAIERFLTENGQASILPAPSQFLGVRHTRF